MLNVMEMNQSLIVLLRASSAPFLHIPATNLKIKWIATNVLWIQLSNNLCQLTLHYSVVDLFTWKSTAKKEHRHDFAAKLTKCYVEFLFPYVSCDFPIFSTNHGIQMSQARP